jgi:hypothetical protein
LEKLAIYFLNSYIQYGNWSSGGSDHQRLCGAALGGHGQQGQRTVPVLQYKLHHDQAFKVILKLLLLNLAGGMTSKDIVRSDLN